MSYFDKILSQAIGLKFPKSGEIEEFYKPEETKEDEVLKSCQTDVDEERVNNYMDEMERQAYKYGER